MDLIFELTSGLVHLPWWGYVVVALALTHITIAAVTIYLHRYQAHRALELHPVVSHFFRLWLWLTTGMVTKEWTAVHRKHHAKCETAGRSAQPAGHRAAQSAARRHRALSHRRSRCGDDRQVRARHARRLDRAQRLLAAQRDGCRPDDGDRPGAVRLRRPDDLGRADGVDSRVRRRRDQRRSATTPATATSSRKMRARNIVPWGILIGGEELHNNHHAYASSARLSSKWFEFDIGWMYIRAMEALGLAQVKKLAPKIRFDMDKARCDLQTLQAVITHRYDVVQRYARTLKAHAGRGACASEDRRSCGRRPLAQALAASRCEGSAGGRTRAPGGGHEAPARCWRRSIRCARSCPPLWARSTASKEQLLHQLEDWCHRAEKSEIVQLAQVLANAAPLR